eukprot:3850025-Rhodomonas_salina.1
MVMMMMMMVVVMVMMVVVVVMWVRRGWGLRTRSTSTTWTGPTRRRLLRPSAPSTSSGPSTSTAKPLRSDGLPNPCSMHHHQIVTF